ncbi:hypothetical protein A628_03849 [Salmonella enterica subsp. enterica serovar Cubana str. 76814]|uniref:Uncharacterized protein n=1 Tax=Salmonella enterica subsp. enterica serovar Cubana str. 76814 TaxID=1192560 RepID=V7ILL4_SALET|nr:hypothetical protein A628_03849 [Salmonella enterica subsp. enterica serovar Cubana str. 76814]
MTNQPDEGWLVAVFFYRCYQNSICQVQSRQTKRMSAIMP